MVAIETPRFLPVPRPVWAKCAQVSTLLGSESAGLVRGLEGDRLVVAPAKHFDPAEQLVTAITVGLVESRPESRLIEFPTGERLLVHRDLVRSRETKPASIHSDGGATRRRRLTSEAMKEPATTT